jgi:hypothetical protein
MKSRSNMETLHCSFCGRSQDVASKLISSPADYPRAYICDECVEKYTPEELRYPESGPVSLPNRPSHCLMCHPNALPLLAAIERWALAERERGESDSELAEVRRMVIGMLGIDAA